MNRVILVASLLLMAGCVQTNPLTKVGDFFTPKPNYGNLCKDQKNFHDPRCYEERGELDKYAAYKAEQDAKRNKGMEDWINNQPLKLSRFKH